MPDDVPDASAVAHYREHGFVILRQAFDPGPLSAEVDRVLADGLLTTPSHTSVEANISFRYVPTMSAGTPVSLELLDRFMAQAARLLDANVIPVRAKAVRYEGNASWHADSELDVGSLGFTCYLEPLTAETGALRVIPGSHVAGPADAGTIEREPYVAATEPGDVIVFDEHLQHSSSGGGVRRQWRVDYVRRPANGADEQHVREYFAELYSVGWDGGYDSLTYPTYGDYWRKSGRVCLADLERLGAHAAAEAEEAFARANRRREL